MSTTQYHTIRVLIADDHALLREGFRVMLSKHTEIEFAGEAENGRELIKLTELLKPDIVFTDIQMPVMDGVEATRILSARCPDTKVIALTIHDQDNLIVDMLEAGARGYLLKNTPKQDIVDAIHSVYQNETYYCRHTSSKLAKMIATSKFNPRKKKELHHFSEREKEVIRLICREFSNKEIASQLGLSVRTIEGYRENIQEKMEVHSTAGMVVFAIRKGIFLPE